jgi:hypothetical protein
MHLSGWLALGAVIEEPVSEFGDPRPSFTPFTEFSGYSRAPVAFGPGMTVKVERFPGPTAPPNALITHGALFDSEGGPRALLLFPLNPPLSVSGPSATFPPTETAIVWSTPVQHLLNASALPDYVDKITIDRGHLVGTWNNRPLTAACKLAVLNGTFVARAAAVRRAAA